jgi:acyl transferase domain-containing protein/acyl carrier protein
MMTRSEIREYLIAAVAEVTGLDAERIDPTCPFHDFGMTSSDAISLSGELEERLERRLPPTLLYDHPTIDALSAALAAPGDAPAAVFEGPPAPPADLETDKDPICIVGLGCRFPGGADDPAGFWANLVAGVDAGREVPADRWDADAYFDPTPGAPGKSYTKRGGFLPDLAGFDAAFFGISPAEALRMDPQQRMVLEVAWSALEHAGIAADRIRGSRTGVFVGMMATQEYARLQADGEGDACFDDPFFAYGVAPSVTAGRLSYALDLRGPSLCVDTACSSSLLTVHLAKDSLRRGECDLAIAGGVSAIVHPGAMVQACHAHMLAGDGSCKTFDERADGFMIGEGCGFVVLERRSDALARGHSILAVVRGSAVNQDGRTNGPTAPSQEAQARVIRAALADAGVTAGAVDYVEAHGSGTRLGDAIELAALHEVFGADREPEAPLLVGAVKTNVGHLLGAAGVAGLIKTVLAVQAGTIPANQNLETPTAALDWDTAPLTVPVAPTPWPAPRHAAARRAGVSSFGWSGTNVHLVVEQWAPEPRTTSAEPVAALPISARTETALACAAARLAEHVEQLADDELPDAAFTLQTGRAPLEWRAAPVCGGPADAAGALRAVADGSDRTYVPAGAPNAAVFLFPGTGDQYAGMGRDLYATDDAFRSAFDACADAALPLIAVDLRSQLRDGRPLDRIDVVHCAVFAVEYALARTLQSWGIAPAALIGYSLGEYAAAAVAGVFSPSDAILLVGRRAQLIAVTPPGGMVAVAAPAADLRRLLPVGVCVAAVNGPAMTVASGPAAATQALRHTLAEQGIAHMPIATGHALHSSLLEPIREPLQALVASVERHAPQIPFVSGAGGAWIEPEQACDPAYWGAQMVQPVHFAAGLDEVCAVPAASLIEVGPGQTLTGLARQALLTADRGDVPVTATLSPLVPAVGGEHERLLRAVAAHWTAGGQVQWDSVQRAGQCRIGRLPTYPFEHQRFWPKGAPVLAAEAGAPLADTLKVPVWTPADAPAPSHIPGPVLVISDAQGRGACVARAVMKQLTGTDTIEATAGAAFAERPDGRFELRPGDSAGHRMLAERLGAAGRLPRTVVHLWGVTGADANAMTRDSIHRDRERGFDSLVALTRALAGAGAGTTRIVAVTDHMQDVTGTETLAPGKAAVLGACTVVPQEYPVFSCVSVDIDPAASVDVAAAQLVSELAAPATASTVAHRDGVRYQSAFAAHTDLGADPGLRDEGVYLLTGGLGNVGLLLAEHLARRVRAPRLVLTGRRGLPPRSEWPDLLARAADDDADADADAGRVRRIHGLEQLGAEVLVLSADAADPEAMRRAVDTTRDRYGAIHGVIHGAGLTARDQFEPLETATATTTEAHFVAKVESLCALDAALGGTPLDFCLLQSSMSAILGGVGFAAYSAANAVLDAHAAAQRRAARPWTSVNWDTWAPTAARNDGASLTQFSMPTHDALAAFERALAAQTSRVVVAVGDLAARLDQWVAPQPPSPRSLPHTDRVPARVFPRPALGEAYVPAVSRHERRLAELWQESLGVARVGVNDNFFDLGGNSLLGLQLVRRVAQEYERNVPAVALFEAPTIRALARYLAGDDAGEAPTAVETELARRREAARVAAGPREPIAIVGLAGRFPGARDAGQFWDNLRNGVESVTFFSDEEMLAAGVPAELLQSANYVKARPVLDDVDRFDAGFFGYSPREAQFTDPQHRVFLECAWTALEDAGYAPRSHPGSVGVFAGENISTYLRYLHEVGALDGGLSEYETVIGNDKDALTTTVSYKLDLTGPSLAVQTFCSTSLVAVHLAAQSLRVGECDMALAGGVSVRVPDRIGHLFVPGGMECPDGHVRAFDAAASGTMFGDGAGIVVLKRLSDAIADGDAVRAVIRGSAVNNDGSLKVGFTAPSVEGQAEVITRAQRDADVEPETISYIEAHGTGTPLGDPIEITALTRAFGPAPAREACPIGSVKTNVGHLDRAAGISGLIKTVLALEHRAIPATLNFDQPNPQIDFAGTPFYVNTALAPWEPSPGAPRRAGVNSLGMGGTNVHVVLEEAPAPVQPPPGAPSAPARRIQLLVLSAATPHALDEASANLANFLRAHPDADLADVAFTLQVGRETFEYRRVIVCSTVQDAVAALEGDDPARALTRRERLDQRPVALMFDGVGEQYPGLAAELYRSEPLFRSVIDECAAVVDPLLGSDVRAALFGDDTTDHERSALDLSALLGRGREAAAELHPLFRTMVAQPAVFILEYALARLLLSWGVRPESVAGYSVGEYVAATVAGRLRLADALALVAERAQLIDALPGGAMLAVAAPAADIQPRCGEQLDLAAINAPATCVVAGPESCIDSLAETLAGDGIACRRLDTTHAFHSRMLAPAADAVTAFVRDRVPMSAPEIPCASNVTGAWITPDEATDPAYWARHMRAPVRFADVAGTLLDDPDRMLVEVGPGQTLGTFVRPHPACDPSRTSLIVSTLPARHDPTDAVEALHAAIARLWLAGVRIDWDAYHAGERRRRVSLPTYPFQRDRYWIDPPEGYVPAGGRALPAPGCGAACASDPDPDPGTALAALPRARPEDWLYLPAWRQAAPPVAATVTAGDAWLIFADAAGVADGLRARLAGAGVDPVIVGPGDAFEQTDARRYELRPGNPDDHRRLVEALRAADTLPTKVALLWGLDEPPEGAAASEWLIERCYLSPLWLGQSLGPVAPDGAEVIVASTGAYNVTGGDRVRPESATAAGPCKVVPLEFTHMRWRQVDVPAPDDPTQATTIAGWLLDETGAGVADTVTAWRGGRRWLPTYEPLAATGEDDGLRPEGVYVITGGLGGIGLAIAERMARDLAARLVLVTRKELPPRHEWAEVAADEGSGATGESVRAVLELEAAGADVLVVTADVADVAAVRTALDQAHRRFGRIDGVIHAAGVPGMGLVQLRTADDADAALRPKVAGTRALLDALQGSDIDLLVLFSSITSLTGGGPGQVDYCAANAYLDAVAQTAGHPARHVVSVDWSEWEWNAWADGLGGYAPAVREFFEDHRRRFGISFDEGWQALRRALAARQPQVVVSTQDFRRVAELAGRFTIASVLAVGRESGERHARPDLDTPYVAAGTDTERLIAELWCEGLGLAEVGIHDNFFELGGNSLLGVELVARTCRQLEREAVPPHVLYLAPTVSGLAQLVTGEQRDEWVDDRRERGASRRDNQRRRRQREHIG